jgi:hypothetical protein
VPRANMDTQASDHLTLSRVGPREWASLRVPPVWFIAFICAFTAMLAVALLHGPEPFYFDSGQYWSLGELFASNGHFSLLNFASPARGYALPLADYALQVIGGELSWSSSVMVKVFNALLFAFIGAVLAPQLAEIAWPRWQWGVMRRVALAGLLIVFWSGFLNVPLSDFPGLAAVLVALVAVARPYAPGWMLLAGAAGGLAVDVRAADVVVLPTMLVLVVWAWWEQRGTPPASTVRRVFCAGLLISGFLIVSLPQSLLAHRHYGVWSFIPGATLSLSSDYLTPGLADQRASGYVGTGERGTTMEYGDSAGQRLLREVKGGQVKGIGQYLGLIASHPIAMSALLARHVINGLDQRFNTPYIEHLHSWAQLWRRLAGFLLVFLALVRVLWPAARHRLGLARWRYPVALLGSCITTIPTVIETRYELPVYLLVYMLALMPGWPNPLGPVGSGIRRYQTLAVLVVAYVAFMLIVWHIVSTTSSQLGFYP